MKNIAKYLLLIISSALLLILISPLSAYQVTLKFNPLVSFFSFFLLSYFITKREIFKFKKSTILLCLIAGLLLIQLPIRITSFKSTLISLPDFLLQLLGIVGGYLFNTLKVSQKWSSFLGLGFLSFFMFFRGQSMWLHKLNFGAFTSKQDYMLTFKVDGIDGKKNSISNETLKGKTVLLDFWHTRCGYCFIAFPNLEKIYLKYKDNKDVKIFAVNKPLTSDSLTQCFDVLASKNYHFPIIKPLDENLPEKFGVTVYPTTIIINKDGKIIFKGELDDAAELLLKMQHTN